MAYLLVIFIVLVSVSYVNKRAKSNKTIALSNENASMSTRSKSVNVYVVLLVRFYASTLDLKVLSSKNGGESQKAGPCNICFMVVRNPEKHQLFWIFVRYFYE